MGRSGGVSYVLRQHSWQCVSVPAMSLDVHRLLCGACADQSGVGRDGGTVVAGCPACDPCCICKCVCHVRGGCCLPSGARVRLHRSHALGECVSKYAVVVFSAEVATVSACACVCLAWTQPVPRCPPGRFTSAKDRVLHCKPCPPGYSCAPDDAGSLPQLCPLGRYSWGSATECSECPRWTSTTLRGAWRCLPMCPEAVPGSMVLLSDDNVTAVPNSTIGVSAVVFSELSLAVIGVVRGYGGKPLPCEM